MPGRPRTVRPARRLPAPAGAEDAQPSSEPGDDNNSVPRRAGPASRGVVAADDVSQLVREYRAALARLQDRQSSGSSTTGRRSPPWPVWSNRAPCAVRRRRRQPISCRSSSSNPSSPDCSPDRPRRRQRATAQSPTIRWSRPAHVPASARATRMLPQGRHRAAGSAAPRSSRSQANRSHASAQPRPADGGAIGCSTGRSDRW